jgi:hypothetical protein
MSFSLIEVCDKKTEKEFLTLPVTLYKNDPNWIRPLDTDIQSVFDPLKNKYYRGGECIRWILEDTTTKKVIGRVAAFYNSKVAARNDQPTGSMGFFECIDNQDAANILFEVSRKWLLSKGMEAMDGPVNFGERDRWWGLLVEGFTPANYCNNYNPPYYQKLFENYGFRDYFQQFTYHRPINKERLSEEIQDKAKRIFANKDYSFRCVEKSKQNKYAKDFSEIYNQGWAKFPGVKPISESMANQLFKTLRPIMDERLMIFAYHLERPIAFFIMLPELNQIVAKLNGNFNLWGKIKFMYYRKIAKVCDRAYGMVFGIIPDFHGKGLEGALTMYFADVSETPGFPYKDLELNWIGDFNPTMMKVARQIGGEVVKRHITYRYLFDPHREFQRCKKVSGSSKEKEE